MAALIPPVRSAQAATPNPPTTATFKDESFGSIAKTKNWSGFLVEFSTATANIVPADSRYWDDLDSLSTYVDTLEGLGYFLPRRAPAFQLTLERSCIALSWLWRSLSLAHDKARIRGDEESMKTVRRAHSSLRNIRVELFAAMGWVEPESR